MIFGTERAKSRRYAGAIAAPQREHRHHPDFNARETRGWKARIGKAHG